MNWNYTFDNRISDLDPMQADKLMQKIPQLNLKQDVKGLVILLEQLASSAKIQKRNYYEIAAIVRDLGFVIGSIRRHDGDPVSLMPSIEPLLQEAGRLTNLPPRDTLMHYTIWNPSGRRLRTYTLEEQERHLIESIKISFPAIRDATRNLFFLSTCRLDDPAAEKISEEILHFLDKFLSGLSHSVHCVKPGVFISCFRPFFEPVTIANIEFRGPGAVTMPLHIFDFLLWGSSEKNERYQQFTADYIPYNTFEFRQYYFLQRNNESFLDRIEKENTSPIFIQNVRSWFKKITGFRHSHFKYASSAYNGHTHHNFQTGSGGHSINDLQLLSDLTDVHQDRINKIINRKNLISC